MLRKPVVGSMRWIKTMLETSNHARGYNSAGALFDLVEKQRKEREPYFQDLVEEVNSHTIENNKHSQEPIKTSQIKEKGEKQQVKEENTAPRMRGKY